MNDRVVVITARGAAIAVLLTAVAAVVLAFALPGPRQALADAIVPTPTPDVAAIERQRLATEASLQRGYTKAVEQLRQVRALTLPIGAAEADAIHSKALFDLQGIRRQALTAVGGATGLRDAGLDSYVAATEARLDQQAATNEPGILLAPGLFQIVRQADALFAATADTATRQLTRPVQAPTGTPPSPSPTGR